MNGLTIFPLSLPTEIFVKLKDLDQVRDSQEVKDAVISQVGSVAEGIRVRNVRKLKDKQILIETESEKDLDILKGRVTAVDNLDCRSPGVVLPKLIIYDVSSKLKEEEVLSKFIAKNLDFMGDAAQNIRIVQKTSPRGKDYVHYVLQVTGRVRDAQKRLQ